MTPAFLQPLADGVLRASWQASVLAVLILIIQRVLTHRISARVRYALWSLVLLRLAVPVSIPTPVSWHNLHAGPSVEVRAVADLPADRPSQVNVTIDAPPSRPIAPADPVSPAVAPRKMSWPERLAIAWAIGTCMALLVVAGASVRVALHVRRQRPVTDPRVLALLESAAADLGVRRLPAVLTGPAAAGPALVGVLRPRLLLPEPVLAFDDVELRLVLLHELAHQKRQDVLSNWVLAFLQAAHWFNPVVHLIFARVRADRELACDERVLSLSPPSGRPAYGRTIVRLLETLSDAPKVSTPAVGILQGRHQLRRRIAMIAENRPAGRAWSLVAVVAASLVAAVACTDAVRGGEKPKINVTITPGAPAVPGAEPGTPPPAGMFDANMGTGMMDPGMMQTAAPAGQHLSKRLPQVKFDEIPAGDALNFVRDAAKLNLFIDRRGLEAAGIDLSAPVTMDLKDITVEQALRLIGKSAASNVELGATPDGDVIVFGVVSRPAPGDPMGMPGGVVPGAEGMMGNPYGGGGFAPVVRRDPAAERAVTRVYDVDALCGNDPNKVQNLVQVITTSMSVGKSSALVNVAPFNGKLVVTATPDLHDQTSELLKMLKSTAPAATTQPVQF